MILPRVIHRPANPCLVLTLGFLSSDAYHDGNNIARPLLQTYQGYLPDNINFTMSFSRPGFSGTTIDVTIEVNTEFVPRPADADLYPLGWAGCPDSPKQWIAEGTVTREYVAFGAGHPPGGDPVTETGPVYFVATPSSWSPGFPFYGNASFVIDYGLAQGDTSINTPTSCVWNGTSWQPLYSRTPPAAVVPIISSRPPLRL